jgi:hypothetical protein
VRVVLCWARPLAAQPPVLDGLSGWIDGSPAVLIKEYKEHGRRLFSRWLQAADDFLTQGTYVISIQKQAYASELLSKHMIQEDFEDVEDPLCCEPIGALCVRRRSMKDRIPESWRTLFRSDDGRFGGRAEHCPPHRTGVCHAPKCCPAPALTSLLVTPRPLALSIDGRQL